MPTLTKEKAARRTPRTTGPILHEEITREYIESGSLNVLEEMMSAALNNTPEETSFEVVVIPMTAIRNSASLSDSIALLKAGNRHKTLAQRKTQKKLKVFDPYEAGRAEVRRLQHAEGGAWSGKELASEFGLTSAVLHRRRKEFRIIYWRDPRGEFHYPKWQFNPAGALLAGIEEVLRVFCSLDEWRVIGYFLNPRKQLDNQRPLDLLRAGQIEDVISHTRSHAEENTW